MDLDHRTRDLGGRPGRVIILTDGTEVLTDSDEQEMFDHEEDDIEWNRHARQGHLLGSETESDSRSNREATPGPHSEDRHETNHTPEPIEPQPSTKSEKSVSEGSSKAAILRAADSALPTKLVNPEPESS